MYIQFIYYPCTAFIVREFSNFIPNYKYILCGWFSLGQAGNSAITVVQPTFGGRSPPCLPPHTRAPIVHPPSPTMKTAVAKLHEYCQQNDVKPEYKDHQVIGGFRCTVTVRGKQYNGETKSKKQDAKHSAAEVALQKLSSSSKLNYMRIAIHSNFNVCTHRFGYSRWRLSFSCKGIKGKIL